METHTITGGGGVDLRVDETGDPDGQAVLFIHGYSQSRLCWTRQLESALAEEFRLVAVDNRGHGRSDKPEGAYADSTLWAEDVQSVIEGLGLDRPVLVGWSYGGLIIADYLEAYGDEHIAGVNLVGAISKNGTEDALAVIGEDFTDRVPGFESTDAQESVAARGSGRSLTTTADPPAGSSPRWSGSSGTAHTRSPRRRTWRSCSGTTPSCRHTSGPASTPGR